MEGCGSAGASDGNRHSHSHSHSRRTKWEVWKNSRNYTVKKTKRTVRSKSGGDLLCPSCAVCIVHVFVKSRID